MAFWPSLIRTVDNIEAVIGIVVNLAVICILCHRKYTTKLLSFRICIMIIAFFGLLISVVVVALSNTIHLFHSDTYLVIVYGPIALLNERFGHFLVYFSLVPPFCGLQFIPGACLLQYLSLSKPHLRPIQRILFAYGLCVAMLLWSIVRIYSLVALAIGVFEPYFLSIHLSPAFDEIVRAVHHTEESDKFHTLGMTKWPTRENPRAMINFAIECVLPSYTISNAVFAITAIKCRGILKSLDIKLSQKTLAMHRRFLVMLCLQNLLPLAVLAIPIGIFSIALISGYSMGLITLIVSFSCWTLPIVQGVVALKFISRLSNTTTAVASGPAGKMRSIP